MGQLKNLFPSQSKEQVREDAQRQLQEFLARGGSVTQVKARKSRAPLTANGKNSGNVFHNLYA